VISTLSTAVLAALCVTASHASAQVPDPGTDPDAGEPSAPSTPSDTLTVQVRQVAGANLYLDVGTRAGLGSGDTIVASIPTELEVLGSLVVVAASEDRAVLGFASEPFPVTRGESLHLRLRGSGPSPPRGPVSVADSASLSGASPDEVVQSIQRAIRDHAGSAPQSDDLTLVCFGRER